eukprot:gene6994-11262_t
MISVLLVTFTLGQPSNNLGPGSGPWQTATPESQGLSTAVLQAAADAVNDEVGNRECYIVVKNGKIVHEQYYLGMVCERLPELCSSSRDKTKIRLHKKQALQNVSNLGLPKLVLVIFTTSSTNEETTRQAWSTTKSMCASLFGVAVEQGWASVQDSVARTVRNARNCNAEARFEHVLSMTGTSKDIADPVYTYDTLGTNCLDTLQEFITQNNPEGLSATEWKDKYWADVLGMEHMKWGTGPTLQCGFTSTTSCRDLARVAQFWLNDGVWAAGAGPSQVMNAEYARKGRTNVFPNKGKDYGYTLWREEGVFPGALLMCMFCLPPLPDPVDPNAAHFNGLFAQCSACKPIWKASRNAIVSKNHPLHASLVQNNSSQVEALVEDSESVAEMAEWWKLLSNTTAAKEAGLPTITAIQRAYLKAAAATT